jgi:VanZ family protein
MGSAANTSRYLVPFLHWLNPTISQASVEQIHFIVRKGGHLSEYAILATLLFFALRRSLLPSFQGALWKSAALSLFISAIYAAGDEFHQSFVGSRTAAFSDVMIDTSGALIALCFILIIGSFWRKRAATE